MSPTGGLPDVEERVAVLEAEVAVLRRALRATLTSLHPPHPPRESAVAGEAASSPEQVRSSAVPLPFPDPVLQAGRMHDLIDAALALAGGRITLDELGELDDAAAALRRR